MCICLCLCRQRYTSKHTKPTMASNIYSIVQGAAKHRQWADLTYAKRPQHHMYHAQIAATLEKLESVNLGKGSPEESNVPLRPHACTNQRC